MTIRTPTGGKYQDIHKQIYLWWGDNGECVHDSVRVLLTDLADEQGTHARAGTTTQWVCKLESLQTITSFRFLTNHIKNGVYKFSSLCVVTFGPVVTSTALTKDKVVWTEDLTKRSRADRVHGTWLQINQHGTGHIFASWKHRRFYRKHTILTKIALQHLMVIMFIHCIYRQGA